MFVQSPYFLSIYFSLIFWLNKYQCILQSHRKKKLKLKYNNLALTNTH